MPSASTKSSQPPPALVTGDLMQDPLKNAILALEKKSRNLEKRKLKLLETRKKAEQGSSLNQDQKEALEKVALVDNSLETVKELHKTISTLDQEYVKLVRKEQKRVKQEKKDQTETYSFDIVLKTIEIQGILGDLSEEVRPDFLSGENGACQLTEDDLSNLDTVYELVNPSAEEDGEKKLSIRIKIAAEHLVNLVQGKDSPAFEDVTYKSLYEVLCRIRDSGYFEKDNTPVSAVESETPEVEHVEEIEEVKQVEEAESPVEEEAPETPAESPTEESPSEEFPATEECTERFEQEDEAGAPEEVSVNGVDLPPELQETPDDEKINFMGESEIVQPESGNPPMLNPVSPVFVPRNLQQPTDDNNAWDTGSSQTQSEPQTNAEAGWQSVDSGHQNREGGFRGRGGRSRGFGGRGRGRGGGGGFRGRDGGNYRGEGGNYRGEGGNYRGEGGNYRGEGSNYRGDGSNYRGGNRGNRGGNRGQRGGPRGGRGGDRGGDRGSYRGGFAKPQQQ